MFALQIVRQWVSTFVHLKNAETFTSAKAGILSPITDKSFRFAVIDNQLFMVKGAFDIYYHKVLPRHSYTIYIISAHSVQKECWQGGKARLDTLFYINWCSIIYCSSVLSTHLATTVSTNGMCSHMDHAFQPSPLPCISVRCPTEFSSTLFIRSLHETPIRCIL
jgi:hypothetical protein